MRWRRVSNVVPRWAVLGEIFGLVARLDELTVEGFGRPGVNLWTRFLVSVLRVAAGTIVSMRWFSEDAV